MRGGAGRACGCGENAPASTVATSHLASTPRAPAASQLASTRRPPTASLLGSTPRALGLEPAVEHPLPPGVPLAKGFRGLAVPQAAAPPPSAEAVSELEGAVIGDCGWTFGGWAIPLLDPPINAALYTASGCGVPWTIALGAHVDTTSTCVLRDVDGGGKHRLYVQNAWLVSDDPGGAPGLPSTNPADTASAIRRLSTGADASGRFSMDYIGYIDSSDGVTFPVHAPVYAESGTCGAAFADDGAAGAYDYAGWRPTAINCRTPEGALPSPSGDYCAYRDPTVLDLRAQIGFLGFHLMVCVEARSRLPIDEHSDAFTAGHHGTSEGTNPRTRVVCYLSPDADFAPGNVAPSPGQARDAFVVIEPVQNRGVASVEWYGVPTVSLTPDGGSLLLLVPWRDNREASQLPWRVRQRYWDQPDRRPVWYAPPGDNPIFGISVFVVSIDDLRVAVGPLWGAWLANRDVRFGPVDLAAFTRIFTDGYHGEVLALPLGQGDATLLASLGDVEPYTPIDPHLHVCGDATWMYFDRDKDDQSKMTRLWALPTGSGYDAWFQGTARGEARKQGEYTVWVQPSCPDAIDTVGSLLDGAKVRDPDVTLAADGTTLAARFSTEIELAGGPVSGLAYALGVEECESLADLAAAAAGAG